MTQLILIETLANGTQRKQALSQLTAIKAQSHATYAVIDATTGKAPAGVKLQREGDALKVLVNDETVAQIDAFYSEGLAAEFSAEGVVAVSDEVLISASDSELVGASSGDAASNLLMTIGTAVGGGAIVLGGSHLAFSGNQNTGSNNNVIDTTPPSTPDIALGRNGSVNTNDATIDVAGIDPRTTWEYSLDGGATWITGTGTSFELADNTTYPAGAIQVRQIDNAGNASAPIVNSSAITTDMLAPDAPSVALATDTGTSSSDQITSDATVNVTGIESGSTWEYSLDGGATWTTGKGSSFELASNTTYAAGTIQTRQTDAANNISAIGSNSAAITIDNLAPANISGIDISTDTGSSTTDFITNTAAQTITATLSSALAAGDVLYGSLDNGATWLDITSKASGTAISWDGATLSGSSAIAFKVIDAAGNTGRTASHSYVHDTSAPTTPAVGLTTDSGSSNSDLITNNAALTLSALEGGATRSVVVDGGAASGTYTAPTGQGSHTVTVTDTDTAGNSSTASITFTLDTTAPTAPVVTSLSTSDSAPDFGGTATLLAGEVLNITVGGATYNNVTVTEGEWSLDTLTATPDSGTFTPLTAGDHSVTATIVDVAGNSTSDTTTNEITVTSSADTSIVVFDLVNLLSSDHSSRTFDAGTDYTIYIIGSSSGSVPMWSNAGALTSADSVIWVTNTVAPYMWDHGSHMHWDSAFSTWASTMTRLFDSGHMDAGVDLWNGSITYLAQGILTALPAGIYTSQGL